MDCPLCALPPEHVVWEDDRCRVIRVDDPAHPGFCPGFPYLGYLPDELCGVPRLASPRVRVEPGSVGLTGRQTGLYPLARPGGWNLIGRTPLTVVDVAAGYFPIRPGDRVRFRPVARAEYNTLAGERL